MQKTMNLGVIANLLSDIARRHTNNSPYRRINTFALLDTYADLESPTFNKTPRDIEIGHFWSRYQKTEPDKPRDICLIAMQKECYWNVKTGEKCMTILLGVAQMPKCVGCPEGFEKTPDEVDSENEDILRAVYLQLCRYHLYKDVVWEGSEDKVQLLATPEQMKCYKDEGKIVSCLDCGVTMKHKIQKTDVLSCFTNCIGDRRVKSLEFKICGCSTIDQEFEDKAVDVDQSAPPVICATCFE